MMLGTTLIGHLLNREYKRVFKAVADARGQDEDSLDIRTEQGVAEDFPIEKV